MPEWAQQSQSRISICAAPLYPNAARCVTRTDAVGSVISRTVRMCGEQRTGG